MSEEWRNVADHPAYEISNLGNVRHRQTGHVLKPYLKNGYPCVTVKRDGAPVPVRVHTMVALAFLGPKPTRLHIIAHGLEGRGVAAVRNIRWATYSENNLDRREQGTVALYPRGSKHYRARLTEDGVAEVRKLRLEGATQDELAARFGVSKGAIGRITRGELWRHVPG